MPSFADLTLPTQRLLLRPLRAEDAAALYEIFSDVEVTRYWSAVPWTSLEAASTLIAAEAELLAAGKHLRLGIELTGQTRLIGTCTLFNLSEQCRRAELGYALASAAGGKGLMHEALTSLLSHAFEQLAFNRIEADVDPRNIRSERTLERLGFRREGLLRERWIVNDEISDSHFYGLLRREWQARRT